MEHPDHEGGEQRVTDLKDHSLSLPIPSQKSEITKTQHLGTSFASSTPEKTTALSRVKHTKDIAELPENFRALSEFFDRMVCSVRLLGLHKKPPTFKHISSQVEVLTGRKFLYGHLAKIMYIIPEVVHIDKILVHDKNSCCMKPDMKITLHLDALEDHHEHSIFLNVSNVFQAKLITLFRKHPEGCDIPEAVLPEPFNESTITVQPDSFPVNESHPLDTTELLEPSHLGPSFSSHFSLKAVVPKEKKTELLASSLCSFIDNETTQETESEKTNPRPVGSSKMSESTPMKLTSESTSNTLLLETPAQSTPRRSASATEDKLKKVISQSTLASNLSVKRSLIDDLDWSETAETIFPQTEIKGTFPSGSEVEKNDWLSGKDEKYVGLPKLVRLIHNIFQSLGRRSVTKEELFHKIIMADCDIDDSSDIERQIALLEKLVPDWICKKDAPSGGFLYSLKSVPELDSICERVMS